MRHSLWMTFSTLDLKPVVIAKLTDWWPGQKSAGAISASIGPLEILLQLTPFAVGLLPPQIILRTAESISLAKSPIMTLLVSKRLFVLMFVLHSDPRDLAVEKLDTVA